MRDVRTAGSRAPGRARPRGRSVTMTGRLAARVADDDTAAARRPRTWRSAVSPRTLSPIAAVTSLVIGGLGLIAPGTLAASFGMTLDPAGVVVARLACAAYLGYAVLAWMARDVTDAAAWRAIAAANAAGWAISGAALALSVASASLDGRVWLVIATQVVFALAWTSTYSRVAHARAASSPA